MWIVIVRHFGATTNDTYAHMANALCDFYEKQLNLT